MNLSGTCLRGLCGLLAVWAGLIASVCAQAVVELPRTGLTARDLAVIVNDDDPLSRRIGDYYQQARHIPDANMIHVRFPPYRSTLSQEEFVHLRDEINRMTPDHVQAYAIAWAAPYRVGCMSVTSALAFGFDSKYCSRCGPTAASPYFDSPSTYPKTDYQLRPAMMLAGSNIEQVRKLIDRGVASDHSFPAGQAYLLDTTDKARSVRAAYFAKTASQLSGVFTVSVLETDAITNRDDVLFYFTGLGQVPHLETLRFLPGALADHLTSAGGQLTDSSQMSSMRWLEAGATASYGTVVEPCNFVQKFPVPGIAMFHYAMGASAIEAYWKSVAWPGEGVFIGEPLARPFAPVLKETSAGGFELHLFSPQTGRLQMEYAATAASRFRVVSQRPLPVRHGLNVLQFTLPQTAAGYWKLKW